MKKNRNSRPWGDARCLGPVLPNSNITVDDIINDPLMEASFEECGNLNFSLDSGYKKYDQ